MTSQPSPPCSPSSPQSTAFILTPTRKVRALLAQFNDSDDEEPTPPKTKPTETALAKVGLSGNLTNPLPNRTEHDNVEDEDEENEDEDVLIPARQRGTRQITSASDGEEESLQDEDKMMPQLEAASKTGALDDLFSDSEDNVLGRKTRNASPLGKSRSPSPLFIPSPENHKSKFLALVEKHRKERKDKEAEEAAKLAQQRHNLKTQKQERRGPRGSSPADDSEEDGDSSENADGMRLAKQARPTRKASKKALEEMNRETQRMSRNMQLAHQARTKKKITKESLLARFNFQTTPASKIEVHVSSSSPVASEDEAEKGQSTPPTSPPRDFTTPKLDKGKGRASSLEQAEEIPDVFQMGVPGSDVHIEEPLKPSIKLLNQGDAVKVSTARPIWSDNDDSESDLEVVTSRADKRKYAAFERLRAKKATEAPSQIALRSLANLIGEDRRSSMNAAAVGMSLRKAARMQAREEREHRIADLKAKGVLIQTAEERDREQQDVEDLLERARQEAADIQKREKAAAKKEGNYTKDDLDDEDDSDDDFAGEESIDEDVDSEADDEDVKSGDEAEKDTKGLLDNEVDGDESASESAVETETNSGDQSDASMDEPSLPRNSTYRQSRKVRVVSDDEDESVERPLQSPSRLPVSKTPQSLTRSVKKQIPGLPMSDDLPIGLTQAFAATMADSQSQVLSNSEEQDSLQMTADLPSPNIAMAPKLSRLDSVDMVSDSQPASQTQPLNLDLSFTQSQMVPQSPKVQSGVYGTQATPSQPYFEPTQDAGYLMSPFMGNRFAAETPEQPEPHSTVDTVIVPEALQDSPIVQRRVRLRRGRINADDSEEEAAGPDQATSAFTVMQKAAAKKARETFDKNHSKAREIVDEAAEESEDEYAGLGGASDDDANDEEDEEDRKMIDEDTQVGIGDEAKLAKLFADRERQQDEAAVSKLMRDIATGGLRRKRGNDDLDLSDEEEAVVRRREAKRREFAKMRRELLKDEAVGKIAEDKKKEAFLRSIEDRHDSDGEEDYDQSESQFDDDTQAQASVRQQPRERASDLTAQRPKKDHDHPLEDSVPSKLNQARTSNRRGVPLNKRPATLAEIRESVSFLIEEPDSQAGSVDLGLSDSEDEPEAYVDLDRHLHQAEADENAEDADDLGDFIVDDDGQAKDDEAFKKPALPTPEARAPFSERRTSQNPNVVNRLSILRQASSSSTSSSSSKMAFFASTVSASSSFTRVPNLLRRATTNSSLGSMAGRDENVSATGVVTSKTERGKASEEKEFIRKGTGGRRNAVNYRPTVREEKMSQRAGVAKKSALKAKSKQGGFLGGLLGDGNWA
jgi:mediator of replication checkpoint protein 1